jgi:hypothetical protein
VLFAKVSNTLWEICHRIAKKPVRPYYKFVIELPTTYGTFARGLPQLHTKGDLCAIPLKKVKFKVKNKEAINSFKNYQRFIYK